MSQNTLIVPNGSGNAVRIDLQEALAALATKWSGGSAPSETYAHGWWADETNDFLQIRSKDNTAWRRAGFLDAPMLGHHGAQVQSKSGAYTVVKADAGSVLTCTGTFTVTLPPTATVGNPYCLTVVNLGTGLITLDGNAAELVDGLATIVVGPGDGISLIGNSTGWISFGQRAGRVLLDRQTPTAVAQVDIKNVFSTRFDAYEIVLTDLVPATDNVDLWARVSEDNGASFVSGATDYKWASDAVIDAGTSSAAGSTGDSKIRLAAGAGSGTGESLCGDILLPNLGGAKHKVLRANLGGHNQAPVALGVDTVGIYKATTNAVTAIRLLFSSGNIASGIVTTYGLRK